MNRSPVLATHGMGPRQPSIASLRSVGRNTAESYKKTEQTESAPFSIFIHGLNA